MTTAPNSDDHAAIRRGGERPEVEPDAALLAAAHALADGHVPDEDAAEVPYLAELRLLGEIARASQAGLPTAHAAGGDEPSTPDGGALPLERWGPLQLLERVGSGGFGEVFRAFDTVLHREVALKLRRLGGEAETAAFQGHLEEARRLARIRHPNVLTVHGVEVHEGRAGMWTDFIRGETLEARLVRGGPLGAEDLLRIGIDLCAALDAVHEGGLLHGDIKTANAMLETGGRTILMDFGAGTRAVADEPFGGSPQGTPIVMAPELIAGQRPSRASDLYALGVLLYRLATGRYPLTASSWKELAEKHRSGRILPVREQRPDLPVPLARAIDACLTRDPMTRPAGAREVAAFLRAADEGVAGGEAPTGTILGDPPAFLHRMIGRREELRELRALLLEARWVTLTGTGGCGKTRLALRAAEEMAHVHPGHVHWVALGALQDPRFLARSVARGFGLAESRRQSALEVLLAHLESTTTPRLLVLDDGEHLIDTVAELAATLLDATPHLRLLVTSRRPSGDPREQTLQVPSLPLPAVDSAPGLEILDSEAVRLFLDRACVQRPGFSVTAAIAPSIARIVRRLDGIPFAIELAAARVGALSVEQIADRLEEGFRLLAGRGAQILPRQQTVQASIEWSYRLLAPGEQRCLARTSVFSGGFTIDAAEAVCAEADDGSLLVDTLETLVRSSIVQFDAGERPRYRLLETVRAFAAERLRALGEEEMRREAHLAWCRRLARAASVQLRGPEHGPAFCILDPEVDNIRSALAWALDARVSEADAGIDLCTSLSRYWFLREDYREGRAHFSAQIAAYRGRRGDRGAPGFPRRSGMHDARETVGASSGANAAIGAGSEEGALGRCLLAAATLEWPLGHLESAAASAEEALPLLRAALDDEGMLNAITTLAFLADLRGDATAARAYLEEALAAHERRGDVLGVARAAGNLGVLESRLGRHREAIAWYERAIPHLRALGDQANVAVNLRNLAYSLMQLGELARARSLAEEGVAVLRRVGQRRQLATSLTALSEIDLAEDRLDHARLRSLEAMHLAREAGDQVAVLAVLTTLGAIALRERRDELSARLFGAAESLHETLGIPIGEGERADWAERAATLRERLGRTRADALWAEGRTLDPLAASELVLD